MQKIKNIINFFKEIYFVIKYLWDNKVPKIIKVASYMAVASLIYQAFKDFQISSLINWIPEAYRIIVINWLTVVVVELTNYFKNKANK